MASCGVERSKVKTLQDGPGLLPVRSSTVAYLAGRPAPGRLPLTRLPFERNVFRVTAAVTLVRREADSDLHVVLRDGTQQLIAEAPLAACAPRATAARRQQMSSARRAVRVCARASITGVAFFDYVHGQTGVAPNGIELHPILGFRCLTSSPPPPPGCAASYPTVCIPPPPPDLDCGDIPFRNFTVRWTVPDPDPHRFDGNHDGVGCAT